MEENGGVEQGEMGREGEEKKKVIKC